MGEFEIIDSIIAMLGGRRGDVIVGPGDDCACVRAGENLLLLTDDVMVEGVHFTRGILDPHALGRRAATIAISDIAAMGGTPRWVLASVCSPPSSGDMLVDLASGLASRAAELGAALVGGNLSRSDVLEVCLAVVGTVDRPPLTRSGARPDDLVALTGPVGGAALGLQLLLHGQVPTGGEALARMWMDPPARVETGRALLPFATAAIDISDGLLQDLGHLVKASGSGARLEIGRLPLPPGYEAFAPAGDPAGPALRGGEDYELIVTLPPAHLDGAAGAARAVGCDLAVVGSMTTAGRGIVLVHEDGREEVVDPAAGWDHFR
jgi:thiamine-monophosphate kinase